MAVSAKRRHFGQFRAFDASTFLLRKIALSTVSRGVTLEDPPAWISIDLLGADFWRGRAHFNLKGYHKIQQSSSMANGEFRFAALATWRQSLLPVTKRSAFHNLNG